MANPGKKSGRWLKTEKVDSPLTHYCLLLFRRSIFVVYDEQLLAPETPTYESQTAARSGKARRWPAGVRARER
jgi:hypothetical protein